MKQDSPIHNRVDRGWESMSVILDQKMPEKKEKKFILWLILPALLLLAGTFFFLNNRSVKNYNSVQVSADVTTSQQTDLNSNKTLKNTVSSDVENDPTETENTPLKKTNTLIQDASQKIIEDDKLGTQDQKIDIPKERKSTVQKNKTLEKINYVSTAHVAAEPLRQAKTSTEKNKTTVAVIQASTPPINEVISLSNHQKTELKPSLKNEGIQFIGRPELIFTLPLSKINSNNNSSRAFGKWNALSIPDIAEIKIRQTKSKVIVWGIELAVENVPGLESFGYSGGLFSQYKIGKFGIGISTGLGTTFERPSGDSSDLAIEPVLTGETTTNTNGSGTLSDENQDRFISDKISNTYFYYSSLDLSFQAGKSISFNTALGFENYYKLQSRSGDEIELDLSGFLLAGESQYNTFVPYVELGIRFHISNHFSIHTNYRNAVKDLVVNSTDSKNTSKIQLGLAYQF